MNAGTNYVTGIEPILEKSAKSFKTLIAASKGKLLEWSPDEENASNRNVDVKMRIDRRHYNCWGLAASPNKVQFFKTNRQTRLYFRTAARISEKYSHDI